MKKFSQFINEATYNREVAIMNAAAWIPGKNNPATLAQKIATDNGEGPHTLFVCDRGGVKIFLYGSASYKVGDQFAWKQDTGGGYRRAPFGQEMCTVENIITLANGRVAKSVNSVGINEKRPLWVFK